MISGSGALVVRTGKRTGRSPKDRFIVENEVTRETVDWGTGNKAFPSDAFGALLDKAAAYVENLTLTGTGTINGVTGYDFVVTAYDGQINGGGNVDKFRIKIWENNGDAVVYDNQLDASDSADPTTALSGGSIVIHITNALRSRHTHVSPDAQPRRAALPPRGHPRSRRLPPRLARATAPHRHRRHPLALSRQARHPEVLSS